MNPNAATIAVLLTAVLAVQPVAARYVVASWNDGTVYLEKAHVTAFGNPESGVSAAVAFHVLPRHQADRCLVSPCRHSNYGDATCCCFPRTGIGRKAEDIHFHHQVGMVAFLASGVAERAWTGYAVKGRQYSTFGEASIGLGKMESDHGARAPDFGREHCVDHSYVPSWMIDFATQNAFKLLVPMRVGTSYPLGKGYQFADFDVKEFLKNMREPDHAKRLSELQEEIDGQAPDTIIDFNTLLGDELSHRSKYDFDDGNLNAAAQAALKLLREIGIDLEVHAMDRSTRSLIRAGTKNGTDGGRVAYKMSWIEPDGVHPFAEVFVWSGGMDRTRFGLPDDYAMEALRHSDDVETNLGKQIAVQEQTMDVTARMFIGQDLHSRTYGEDFAGFASPPGRFWR